MQLKIREVTRKDTLDKRSINDFKLNADAGLSSERVLNKVTQNLSLVTSPVYPDTNGLFTVDTNGAADGRESLCERNSETLDFKNKNFPEVGVIIDKAFLCRSGELELVDAQRHGLHFVKPGANGGVVAVEVAEVVLCGELVLIHVLSNTSHILKC